MSRIILRNGNDAHELTHIGPDADLTEAVSGEQTIRFTVLPEDVAFITFSTRIEFEGQYYEAAQIRRYGTALGVFADVQAEHISYRLSRMDVAQISMSGTKAAVLARILSGSGLTAGSTPSGSLSAGTLENVTRREALNTAAALMGGEIEYSGASVSIVAHRGATTRIDIMDEDSVIAVEDEGATDGETAREALTAIHGERIMDSVLLNLDGTEAGMDGNGWKLTSPSGGTSRKYFYLDLGPGGSVINDSGISAELPAANITSSTTVTGQRIINASASRARLLIRPEGVEDMTTAQFKAWLAEETPRIVYKLADCEGKTYRITLGRRGSLSVGDEIHLVYAPLSLDVNTRLISVARNPYRASEITIEVGKHIPEITDSWLKIEQKTTQAKKTADTAAQKADTAAQKADAAKTKADDVESSLSNYVQTSEVSAKVDAYVNSDTGKASITASLSGTYQTIEGMSGYETKTELSADIGAYIDTQAGTAKITAAVSGTYAEKSELTGYEKKTELSADIGAYIDTQAGTAKITAAVSGTYAEKSALTGYEKKTELSADIGAYIDTQAGTAKVVSACSGTYQTVAGMSGYVTTTGLNTSIGQYIDSTTGKAKVVSACSGTYQTVAGMSGYVTTTGLNTSIGQYIDSTTGSAKVVSACSGTYQTQSGMSSYYTKTQVDTEISQSVSPIESAISLTASYGSGTIGSNVRALLQLVANADSSSINIKADKINFQGFTTFLRASDIGSSGSTSIDGGRILTGTISADRIDAENIKLRALYGSGTSYANVALLYSSGDDLYIGQSMSSSSTNVDMIKMRANTINIGRSDTSQLVIDNVNKVIRHNYTANTANIDLGNSSHQFNNLYVKKIYLDGTELTGGGSDTLYVSGSTTNYIKLNSSKDFVASATGFSLGSSSYPFDEFYCGNASYYLKHSSAGIIPSTTSTSSSYFQLGSSSYPFNDLYVKNLHVSGSFDMAGSTVKMGGTSSYYLEANTSRELKPSSSSATYPAYLGTSSIYWHYAYIGSNTAIIGSSGTSTGSKLGFFGTTAVVRQTLSLTSNNMSYTSVTASNYLYALNNLIGILKKHGLIAT